MPDVYPDVCVTEGDAVVSYSQEGWKCKRTFKVTGLDPDGSALLLDVFLANGIPARGEEHPDIIVSTPYIDGNAFQADIITAKAISSTQAIVEVDYAVLSPLTWEALDSHNNSMAYCTVASSVHAAAREVDCAGQTLAAVYQNLPATPNIYQINDSTGRPIKAVASNFGPFSPGMPNIKYKGNIHIPCSLITFQRRETIIRKDVISYVGTVNRNSMTIAGTTYQPQSLLMSRIESESRDGGYSYIMTYQLQVAGGSNSGYPGLDVLPNSGLPNQAIRVDADGESVSSGCPSGYVSGWGLGCYYVISAGSAVYASGPNNGQSAIGISGIPDDTSMFLFKVYASRDFTSLFLA